MIVVDLFSGCGGFSLGAHRAGFEVAAAFDLDPTLTWSFSKNFPDTKLILGDIAPLTGKELVAKAETPVDGLIGGPPCQGFSTIGRRDPKDPRRDLVGHFFRLVKEVRPAFFVFENVRGLASPAMRPVLDDAMSQLGNKYRTLGPILLDAADFGAATSRKRLFVIGIRRERGISLEATDMSQHEREAATVHSALADFAGAELLRTDKDGFDHWKIVRRGRPTDYARGLRSPDLTFTSHRIVHHKPDVAARFAEVLPGGTDEIGRHPRLAWNGQCPTLRAGTGSDKGSRQAVRPLHPDEPRVITVREAARLQGFPDQHLFHKTIWHSFRMIGNSVSPIMGEAILRAVASKLELADGMAVAAE